MNRNTRLTVLACVLVTAAAVLVGYAVAQDRSPRRRTPGVAGGPGGMGPDMTRDAATRPGAPTRHPGAGGMGRPGMMGGPGAGASGGVPGMHGGLGRPMGRGGEPGRKEPAREVHRLLRKKLPKVDFRKNKFSDVVEFLSDQSGINMFVKWKVLVNIDVVEKSEVSVTLTNVTVEKALKIVLEAVSDQPLGFVVDENVITISTREDLLAAWNIHMKERAMAAEAAFPPKQAEHMGRMIGLIERMKNLCFDPQAVGVMAVGALKEDVRRKSKEITNDLEDRLRGTRTQGLRNAIHLTLKDIYKRQGENVKVLDHLRALIVENDKALQEAKKKRR